MNAASHGLSGLFADRYAIERKLGRGASASVYLAHDTKQDREIALKVLDNELANVLGAKRFLQEIHITSRLQHPHILPIHDSGEWDGLLYYVLPFVAGESLRARLDREKQLPIEECVQLTCDVASALAYAHSKGVIHRDVKPENILLSDGHALVADFGIARAIDVHTGERLTSSGLIVGTSQYMSPEQASGEREVDARSDIYSLGCVLYEMLAGIEPFVGPNVQAVIAQRFTHAPRPVTTFRPAVPEHLVQVLDRALAISPADRFQSMKEFEAALPATTGSHGDRRRPGRSARDLLRTRKGKFLTAAAAVIAIALVAASVPTRRNLAKLIGGAPVVDSTLFVVFPMPDANGKVSQQTASVASAVIAGLNAFNVPVVSDAKIDDAIGKNSQPSKSRDALDIAENVGAGNLIWISPGKSAAGVSDLKLYDVKTNNDVNSASIRSADSVQAALYTLLRAPSRPASANGGDGLTKSFSAWRAYGRGHVALKQWDLQRAEKEFESAIRTDPDFVPAQLWSAQLTEWKHSEELRDEWTRAAAAAAANAQRLSPRDRHLALALSALGQKDFPAACAEYKQLINLDSMDFLGWHGLGECESRDERVIPSKKSPSGFAFRSGYGSAADNYLRATRLDPGAHSITPFDSVMRLLPVFVSTGRRGRDSSGVLFAAWPSLQNDTLSFIPYPIRVWSSMRADRSRYDAFVVNADKLFDFVRSWTHADPNNADAYEALAALLEVRGDIATRAGGGLSASDAVSRAIALAKTDRQKLRAHGTEVRLRIKRGDFAGAEQLSDSLLTHFANDYAGGDLISAAAFTGRVARLAKEAEANRKWLPIGYTSLQVPPMVFASAASYFARAAMGDCGPELDAAESRLLSQLESYTTEEQRPGAIHVLTSRARSLATPCREGASALKIANPETPLARMQQTYARKDFRSVRRLLDSLATSRANMRPGDLSVDVTYQEAWLRAAIGDTTGAIRQLDLALNALPVFNASSLKDPASASALGRAMLLRANLATAKGDRTTSARWGNAVRALWRHADAELQAQLRGPNRSR